MSSYEECYFTKIPFAEKARHYDDDTPTLINTPGGPHPAPALSGAANNNKTHQKSSAPAEWLGLGLGTPNPNLASAPAELKDTVTNIVPFGAEEAAARWTPPINEETFSQLSDLTQSVRLNSHDGKRSVVDDQVQGLAYSMAIEGIDVSSNMDEHALFNLEKKVRY